MGDVSSGNDSHRRLLAAFIRIHDVFSSFGHGTIGGLNLYQAEDLVRDEMFILYNSCQSMARDIITGKIYGYYSCYSYCGDPDIDNAASDAVWHLFGHRKAETGVFEIVGVVQSLYNRNPEPTGFDVFFWLRKTVVNQVNNYNFSRFREKNPEFVRTAKKISRFLKNSERYACEGTRVRDTVIDFENSDSRSPSADEIITLCGWIEPQPTNVPAAVDLIFDLLVNQVKYRSEVTRGALREAVFRVLEPRLPSWQPGKAQWTPLDDYLLGQAEKAAMDTLDDAALSYIWRKDFTEVEKKAFLEAGSDYLFDIVYRGEPSVSRHKYLAAHLEKCSSEVYETVYKGSMQHFFIYLLENWRKWMKGGNPREIDKDRKKPGADSEKGDI